MVAEKERTKATKRTKVPKSFIQAFEKHHPPPPIAAFTDKQIRAAQRVVHDDIMRELSTRGVWFWDRWRVPMPGHELIEKLIDVLGVTKPGQHIQLTYLLIYKVNAVLHSELPGVLSSLGKSATTSQHRGVISCNQFEQHDNAAKLIQALGCTYYWLNVAQFRLLGSRIVRGKNRNG